MSHETRKRAFEAFFKRFAGEEVLTVDSAVKGHYFRFFEEGWELGEKNILLLLVDEKKLNGMNGGEG